MHKPIPVFVVSRETPAEDLLAPVSDTDGSLVVYDNDGNVVVRVSNSGSEPGTVTLMPQGGFADISFQPTVIEIAPLADGWIGPFPPAIFNDETQTVFLTENTHGVLEFTGLRF